MRSRERGRSLRERLLRQKPNALRDEEGPLKAGCSQDWLPGFAGPQSASESAPKSRVSGERFGRSPFLNRLQLIERARPILAQQPRQRAVRQQFPARLTRGAVIRLIRGVTDALDFGA